LRGSEVLGGLRSRKEKIITIFRAKNQIRVNFL